MIRFRSLSPAEREVLLRLDDGYAREDSVGVHLSRITDEEAVPLLMLAALGLVELRPGPAIGGGLTDWVRLTADGWRVRAEADG